jgi:hypothetical protein
MLVTVQEVGCPEGRRYQKDERDVGTWDRDASIEFLVQDVARFTHLHFKLALSEIIVLISIWAVFPQFDAHVSSSTQRCVVSWALILHASKLEEEVARVTLGAVAGLILAFGAPLLAVTTVLNPVLRLQHGSVRAAYQAFLL